MEEIIGDLVMLKLLGLYFRPVVMINKYTFQSMSKAQSQKLSKSSKTGKLS